MSHRFVRCPHCKMPHDAAERICPLTGRRIEPASGGARSRMSERPPPERRPEPMGFDATRVRADREPTHRIGEPQQPSTATGIVATRTVQQDLVGRIVSERYLVKNVLGEGGMGTVYEAEHMGLGRQVAIKVLNPSQAKKRVAVKRFQQEARAAGAIGHPNICEVYDLGLLDDGSPYLVMEKLIGTTLADRISREGGLPFDEIADVMIQVLSGLIAAHDKGIVHRDIKPENIFLARRIGCPPIVKILDFGVSKMMPQFQGGDEQLDLTRTGMVMGTPYYMSPEQARGERNLDGRVDVYACGVMMYEAIVGKRPFLAPNYNALLLSIISTTPKPLREVRPATPPALDAIVQRSMAKARDDRYPTANAVLRDMQSFAIATSPGPAGRMPAPPTAEERMRAPVLGGGIPLPRDPQRERDRESELIRSTRGARRAPDDAAAAGATLRSRMADGPRPPAHSDHATRLDIKTKEPLREHDSESIDIPIHVTGSDVRGAEGSLVTPSLRSLVREPTDDEQTAIFRPGLHPYPATPTHPRSPSATRIAPAPDVRRAPPSQPPPPMSPQAVSPPAPHPQSIPQQAAKPPQAAAKQAPQAPPLPRKPLPASPQTAMSPVDFSDLTGDDWDSETVVKKPAALTTSRHRDRPSTTRTPATVARPAPRTAQNQAPPQPPVPRPAPFNPDETVRLSGELEVEVDFDDTHNVQRQTPPRRPR